MSFLICINSYFAGTYQNTGDESEVRGELWECIKNKDTFWLLFLF